MAEVYKCRKSSTVKRKGMPDIIKIFTDLTFRLKKKKTELYFFLKFDELVKERFVH